MVDGSYDHSRRVAGIGLVLHETRRRGRNGVVTDRIAEAYADVPSGLAEVFAVVRALEIARDRGFSIVRVRSDYNPMRRKLKREHRAQSGRDRADLHGLALRLAAAFAEVEFAYQPRRKNQNAHRLARLAAQQLEPSRAQLDARLQPLRAASLHAAEYHDVHSEPCDASPHAPLRWSE